jgi:hypothetical protein
MVGMTIDVTNGSALSGGSEMQAPRIPKVTWPAVAIVSAAILAFGNCRDATGPTPPRQLRPNASVALAIIAEGKQPIGFAQIVDCDGTAVSVEGDGTLTFVLRDDGSDGLHFLADISMRLTGAGLAGLVSYSGSTSGNVSANVPLPPFEVTVTTKGNLQSSEAVPTNFSLHQNFHLTMNANGVISATVDNVNCQGTMSAG